MKTPNLENYPRYFKTISPQIDGDELYICFERGKDLIPLKLNGNYKGKSALPQVMADMRPDAVQEISGEEFMKIIQRTRAEENGWEYNEEKGYTFIPRSPEDDSPEDCPPLDSYDFPGCCEWRWTNIDPDGNIEAEDLVSEDPDGIDRGKAKEIYGGSLDRMKEELYKHFTPKDVDTGYPGDEDRTPNEVHSEHWRDEDGHPTGGCTWGTGFTISWQNGPLGRGEHRLEPNGAFTEDIIYAAIDRLEFYQASDFACEYNDQAIDHLNAALNALNERTKERVKRKVEGLHKE